MKPANDVGGGQLPKKPLSLTWPVNDSDSDTQFHERKHKLLGNCSDYFFKRDDQEVRKWRHNLKH